MNPKETNEDEDSFFLDSSNKKSKENKMAKIKKHNEELEMQSDDEDQPSDDEEDDDDMAEDDGEYDDEEMDENDSDMSEDQANSNESDLSDSEMEASEQNDSDLDEITKQEIEDKKVANQLKKKGIKEDIYGRLVDKKGEIVKNEKYIPPAQRLQKLLDNSSTASSIKLAKLSKQLNGLLNRLSTANIHSISNQIIQMFYSNQFTRFELIETIYTLLNNGLIGAIAVTPIRLLVEHAALVVILSANIGIELGKSEIY